MNANPDPVLIVGAGPTGLAAALELTRFGIPVRIVDKAPQPSPTSRALAVQARTLELLHQRGLAEEIVRLGNRVQITRVWAEGKSLLDINFSGLPSRYPFLLLLSQAETERILRDELLRRGINVERPVELVALAQAEQVASPVHAVLRKADGSLEELNAPFLIAAEGAHSSVRHTLNLQFAGASMKQNFLLADLHVDGLLPDAELSLFVSQKGFMGFFPMGQRHFRFIASDPQEQTSGSTVEPTLAEMQSVFDAYSAGLPVTMRDLVWSSRFHINSRMLQSLRERSIFFGGDAAHIHSPAGGQGMNTGIQDMIDLGWKMALVLKGHANPELLDTYGTDRLPVIRSILKITEGMTDAAASLQGGGLLRQLLTNIAPIMAGSEAMQRKATSRLSQIALDYRGSPISETHSHPGHLHGGDRLPYVLTTSDDGSRNLQDLSDPTRFTLLLTNGATLEAGFFAPWRSIVNTVSITAPADEHNRERYTEAFGKEPGIYLVRPDSYLAFAGKPSAAPALQDWFNRWMKTPEH